MPCELDDLVPGHNPEVVAGASAPVPGTTISTGAVRGTDSGSGTGTTISTDLSLGGRPATAADYAARVVGHWLGLFGASARRRWNRDHGMLRAALTFMPGSFWDDVVLYIARHRWAPEKDAPAWVLVPGYVYYAAVTPALFLFAAGYATFRRFWLGGPVLGALIAAWIIHALSHH